LLCNQNNTQILVHINNCNLSNINSGRHVAAVSISMPNGGLAGACPPGALHATDTTMPELSKEKPLHGNAACGFMGG